MKSSKILPSANSTLGEFPLNIGLAIWRLKYFYETFVQDSTAVFLMSFCAENPPHRQAEKRYVKIKRIKWKNGNQMFG